MSPEPHIPRAVGLEALSELDQVDWSSLDHAYGEGRVGIELEGDVAGSLALIVKDVGTALAEGLYSNVCHQGTVYEASAFALPFVGAIAAGDVSTATRVALLGLFADIAAGGSHVALNGSYEGAYGAGVDALIRATVVRCDPYLSLIEQADADLLPLVAAIREVTTSPSDENRQAVFQLIDPAE
jgi:hypothetical protein